MVVKLGSTVGLPAATAFSPNFRGRGRSEWQGIVFYLPPLPHGAPVQRPVAGAVLADVGCPRFLEGRLRVGRLAAHGQQHKREQPVFHL
jgi:hypothetical protein